VKGRSETEPFTSHAPATPAAAAGEAASASKATIKAAGRDFIGPGLLGERGSAAWVASRDKLRQLRRLHLAPAPFATA
jgi:hypothetical protein